MSNQHNDTSLPLPSPTSLFLGFLASCLVAWAAGALFLDRIPPTISDPVTKLQVYPQDAPIQYRSEGWATSRNDAHGMNNGGMTSLESEHPVIIWGDSFVQALQVEDNAKMNAVLTSLCTEAEEKCSGVGIGWFADAVADYYFKMQHYSEIIGKEATHVILFGQIQDILPGSRSHCRNEFIKEKDGYRFIEKTCPPHNRFAAIAQLLYDMRLAWLSHTLSLARKTQTQLHLPISRSKTASPPPPEAPLEAWHFMLDSFNKLTNGRLIFVYAPETPYPDNTMKGNSMVTMDPNQPLVSSFQAVCEAKGITFLNMQQHFATLYEKEHRFPRGFADTVPWKGHLNSHGHRLIAKAIFQALRQ